MSNVLMLLGGLLLLLGLFVWKPLGLPPWVGSVGLLAGMPLYLAGLWLARKRAKDHPASIAAETQLRRIRSRKWLVIAIMLAVGFSAPFWIPYTSNIHLPFQTLVIVEVIPSIIVCGVLLFVFRQKEKRLEAEIADAAEHGSPT